MAMTKGHWYAKGMNYARLHTVQAWGSTDSWQRKAFKRGYEAGRLYLEYDAMLMNFDDVTEYRKHLIRQTIKD